MHSVDADDMLLNVWYFVVLCVNEQYIPSFMLDVNMTFCWPGRHAWHMSDSQYSHTIIHDGGGADMHQWCMPMACTTHMLTFIHRKLT